MRTLIIPTLNAAADWNRFSSALLTCATPDEVIVVDSSSSDGTADLARAAGFRVHSIPFAEFNHGRTRQFAAEMLADTEVLIYLTQDTILQDPTALKTLLAAFDDPSVAAAYGRQLPRIEAGPIEAHARKFNYPTESDVRGLASRQRLGFKAIFISNSFAAYRRSALLAVGGFPVNTIFGEDTVIAAKLLLAGWKIAYVAEARVYHSHGYTWSQEFRRYFDIGVLHSREAFLLGEFGQVSGEGKRFVVSELKYLWPRHAILIPSAIVRSVLKLLGYRLGRIENKLTLTWKRRLSMHSSFWK
jgi:rhamnosyltransferase